MRTKILFLGAALALVCAAARAQQDAPPPPPPIAGQEAPDPEPSVLITGQQPPAPADDASGDLPPPPPPSADAAPPPVKSTRSTKKPARSASKSKRTGKKPAQATADQSGAPSAGVPSPAAQPAALAETPSAGGQPPSAGPPAEPRAAVRPAADATPAAVAGRPPAREGHLPAASGEQAWDGRGELRMPKSAAEKGFQVQPGTPEEYIIVKGDTLWDLSQKFLNNAWYWPKIWSQNPGIENPHWIYPGNKLRIVPGAGPQAPAQVEIEQQQPQEPQAEAEPPPADEEAAPPPDVAMVTKREMQQPNREVSVSGKVAYTPHGGLQIRDEGLVSQDELRNAGIIDASFEEKEMLSLYDTAYVRFRRDPGVQIGDRLILFRPAGDIVQPITRRTLGVRTKTVGDARVIAWDGRIATVMVTRGNEEIQRGDRVRTWTDQMLHVSLKPNTRELAGVIVTSVHGGLTRLGEANEVYIDKGEADGVEPGNTFQVLRKGDGLNAGMNIGTGSYTSGAAGARAADVKTPEETVGLLMVVSVKRNLSTAIVVRSVRELEVGERVVMRVQGAGGP